VHFFAQRQGAAGDLGDQGWDHTVLLAQQRQQQVGRLDGLVVVVLRQLLGSQQRFL